MIKKFVLTFIISLFAALSAFSIATPVSADTGGFEGRSGNGCQGFAGLISWDCNVKIDSADSIKSGVWTIAANIFFDITIVAAYLVLGYVIYGGYLYIFSSGDAGKIATAKKTLVHAFIGLAIVLLANVIINSIRAALGANFDGDCARNACASPGSMISNGIQWVIGMAGIICAIFIVYGGVGYMTSTGDSAKLQKAKQSILYAVIGLIIVAIAEIITAFVTNLINDSKSQINETVIAKEVHDIKNL